MVDDGAVVLCFPASCSKCGPQNMKGDVNDVKMEDSGKYLMKNVNNVNLKRIGLHQSIDRGRVSQRQ
jgi:hypothetical protein